MKIPKSEPPPFHSRSFVLQKNPSAQGEKLRGERRAQGSPALLLLSTNGSLRLCLGERGQRRGRDGNLGTMVVIYKAFFCALEIIAKRHLPEV